MLHCNPPVQYLCHHLLNFCILYSMDSHLFVMMYWFCSCFMVVMKDGYERKEHFSTSRCAICTYVALLGSRGSSDRSAFKSASPLSSI